MSPPKYKLTYFNSRGIVEPLRYMFAYKEVNYDDVRITQEEWPALKPQTPFGKLPTLEFDGRLLAETAAINRYIAKELGLYGKSGLEEATIDMYLFALNDCFVQVRTFIREEDPDKKAAAVKKFFGETLPPFLDRLNHYLNENGGKHYVGNEITLADLCIAYAVNELRKRNAAVFEKYPVISKHIDAIHAIPQIKAWLERRPQTEF